MACNYPALYKDAFGEQATQISNDGKQLRMRLRDIEFVATGFDDFEPIDGWRDTYLTRFPESRYQQLSNCSLGFDMPVTLMQRDATYSAFIHVWLVLGQTLANGALDSETLNMRLGFRGKVYGSGVNEGWFEDALSKLGAALPDDVVMKNCFTCAFSDYHPVGSPMFGGMGCFRDKKQAYLKVSTKSDLLTLWDPDLEQVQETYLCEDYQKRIAGTGYRG